MQRLRSILYKIENGLLVALVYLYSLVRGKAIGHSRDPKRVLIWQEAKLGDIVCTTPLFSELKKCYPNARLVVMGNAINKQVLADHPSVDSYVVMSRRLFENLNIIRRQRFDFACTITPNFRNLAALFLAGIPIIAAPRVVDGWSPYQTKPYTMILPLVASVPHHFGSYAPREYLRLLEPVHVYTSNTKKTLKYSREADETAEKILRSNRLKKTDFVVVMSPVVANRIKQWPLDRFARLTEYLVKYRGATVFLIGTKAEVPVVEEMFSQVKNKSNICSIAGELTIDELKAFISKASLFISVDTGPVYIAEALEVPTVDILGPMAEGEQPPRGEFHAIVKPEGEYDPQLHIMNARTYDKDEALRQVNAITVEQVIAVCDEIISKIKARG